MIEVEKVLHQPEYKGEGFQTVLGRYNGKEVIIKTSDSRIIKEKEILEAIRYPNIPKVIDVVRGGGRTVSLVLERMPGQPLDEYVGLDEGWNSRKLDVGEIQTIVNGFSECLLALRAKGYLYRDLSLNHIILDGQRVSLVDMESCVKQESPGVWRVDSRVGTWETMAHEEFTMGNRMLECASTYMLGVLTFQLALGSNPFTISAEQTPNEEVQRIWARDLHKQLPDFDTGNDTLNQLLTKALQPAPSKRFETIEDFQAALGRLQKSKGVELKS